MYDPALNTVMVRPVPNGDVAKDLPFKIGDTVRLNSGGELMTIGAINRKSVTCKWQVKGQPKSELYPSAALTKAGKPFSFEQIVSDAMKLVQERRDRREKESTVARPKETVR